MLFKFILQFTADREKAEASLLRIFLEIAPRLEEAIDSPLSIYCWLQQEARKILLEQGDPGGGPLEDAGQGDYEALLKDESEEHRRVFREWFLRGKSRGELACQWKRDPADIDRLMRESLVVLRTRMR